MKIFATGTFVALSLMLLSVKSGALMGNEVTVRGTVKSYSDREVILVDKGEVFSLPRSMLSPGTKLIANKETQFTLKTNLLDKIYLPPAD